MSDPCKLCLGATRFRFSKTVLGRYQAGYFECDNCGCLQVLSAPWLTEAYATESWAIDTGLIARNLQLAGRIGAFLKRACPPSDLIVDFGGGTGMLTRLLRDAGWQVLCHDPYRKPLFVSAFHVERLDGLTPTVIIASEVFEHFEAPRSSLEKLFASAPIIIFSTEAYGGQGEDWWYLAPDLGQHVFFFSKKALDGVAAANGFTFVDAGLLKYFVHSTLMADPAVRARLEAGIRASADAETGVATLVPYLTDPYQHVARDYELELQAQRAARHAEPTTSRETRAGIFSAIYANNVWGATAGAHDVFDSGWGSDPKFSTALARRISELSSAGAGLSVVDVGCGDFRTGNFLLGHVPGISRYDALDIVPELIARNQARFGAAHPSLHFHCADAVTDPLPDGDVVLIRQVLQHLSNAEALAVLRSGLQASRRLLVIVEHVRPMHLGEWNVDKVADQDIRPGKGINLRLPPFRLQVLDEFDVTLNESERLRVSCLGPQPQGGP
jgi:SAM-dependent methyltransferase